MAKSKFILAVGLSEPPSTAPAHIKDVPSTQVLHQKIAAEVKQVKDAGYDLDVVLLHPDEVFARFHEFEEKLNSKTWDGVVIGYGVRGPPHMTEFLEKLVNASRELAPKTRIGFTTTPDDLLQTVERNFA